MTRPGSGVPRRGGVLPQPPEPERGDDWIRFPSWSESRYLARVAARAPGEVLKLAAELPPTENVRVHEDVLEIASQLPGQMAARLARKEADWLRGYSGHLMSLPTTGGELLAHLACERETAAAFELADTLLAIVRGEVPTSTRRRASARMSEYSYGRIIECAWAALMEAEPARAVGFLCDRLADVVRIGFTEPDEGHDLTYVWRPAIEDHAQNLGHSLLDTLVEAVRDRALRRRMRRRGSGPSSRSSRSGPQRSSGASRCISCVSVARQRPPRPTGRRRTRPRHRCLARVRRAPSRALRGLGAQSAGRGAEVIARGPGVELTRLRRSAA